MISQEFIDKYFDCDEDGFCLVKEEYVIKLNFFEPDYISSIEEDMVYSMASDSKYSRAKLDPKLVQVYKRVEDENF